MASQSSTERELLLGIIDQLLFSCRLIIAWNKNIQTSNEFLYSDDNLQILAADCMMLETIGELVKRICKINNKIIFEFEPNIPWKQIMKLRDRIAHGYFELDTEIIFNIIQKDILPLQEALQRLKAKIEN